MLQSFASQYNISASRINYIFLTISKKLRIGWISSSGRNFAGRICVHHRGGGNKRCYYHIDFYRRVNCYGYIIKKLKTSFFTSLVGLVVYENGLTSYILMSDSMKSHKIYSGTYGRKVKLDVGTALPIQFIKLFATISNVELYPFTGSILARSAGTSVMVTTKLFDTSVLKLKSGWNLKVSNHCICSIGSVSNSSHRYNYVYKKAGKVRSLGIRPTVRGVAMNPCDHPHGGGEGKKSPPASARTPWGKLTKGTKTVVKFDSAKRWRVKKKNK